MRAVGGGEGETQVLCTVITATTRKVEEESRYQTGGKIRRQAASLRLGRRGLNSLLHHRVPGGN